MRAGCGLHRNVLDGGGGTHRGAMPLGYAAAERPAIIMPVIHPWQRVEGEDADEPPIGAPPRVRPREARLDMAGK